DGQGAVVRGAPAGRLAHEPALGRLPPAHRRPALFDLLGRAARLPAGPSPPDRPPRRRAGRVRPLVRHPGHPAPRPALAAADAAQAVLVRSRPRPRPGEAALIPWSRNMLHAMPRSWKIARARRWT